MTAPIKEITNEPQMRRTDLIIRISTLDGVTSFTSLEANAKAGKKGNIFILKLAIKIYSHIEQFCLK